MHGNKEESNNIETEMSNSIHSILISFYAIVFQKKTTEGNFEY